jgi:LuxR family maltose regulon positive regulatory protein
MLRSLREKSSDQARALDVARIDAALAVVLRARGETDAMTQAAMRALAYAMDADAPSVVTGLATDFDPVLAAVLRKPDLDDEPLRSFARRLRSAAPARRAATDEALSPRELAVLGELCVGRANKEIGRQLDLTENTVKFHLKRIYEKLGAHTRSGAVTAAIQRGLIRID